MKNIEIELKYHIKDVKKTREQILALGAQFQKQVHCIDTYYIVPNNAEGRKYLRLREQEGEAELDYHFATSQMHTEEWETEIGSAAVISAIFQQLGYKIDVIVDKIRKTYSYQNSKIVLDEVKDLGPFVEIESPTIEELKTICKSLKLKESDMVKGAGYSDLMKGRSFA